jgi:prolyl-tRNA editing enzyme YbaK/EbsC (Cys-tRNA(Pro) deacylase)
MAHTDVLAWLALHAPDLAVLRPGGSTATVAEAAAALGVAPGRIAKTLAMTVGNAPLLLVAAGDARLDNQKARAAFGGKPRLLDAQATLALTGHAVGGVCPFGLRSAVPVWLDRSLAAYATVFPAAGSRDTALEIAPDRLASLVGAGWVDATRPPSV